MAETERLDRLTRLDAGECRKHLSRYSENEREELPTHWRLWARTEQLPPPGDWRTWLIMAGRGFGKTRAGAEWVRMIADADPSARIALVGATLGEARAVMVEGESGVLTISPLRRRPDFEPSLRRLVWPNGAQAMLYSAGEPEALRGPQHSHACRPGAEGSLRERGAGSDRCPPPLHRRRRERGAPGRTRRRRELAHRGRSDRRVGRAGLVPCLLAGRKLELHPPARRDADI